MRSDNLKRHMLVHKDLLSLPRHEIREELKQQQVKENGYDILGNPTIEQLRQQLLEYNAVYLEKIEFGRKISKIIRKGVVYEETLPKEHLQALELYRKRMPRFDVSTSILQPWQQQALELLETPTD